MQKSAPSAARIAAMVVFTLSCFGLLLFLWIAFGGPIPFKPQGYRFTTSFSEAGQLATEGDVRISGVPVGKVKEIELDAGTGRSVVTIQLEGRYAPLPSDARAILRQKTLLGETYVELSPGSPRAPKISENGALAAGQVSETVELDEVLRTLDPRTRRAFQSWMQTQAQAVDGRGRDINDALGNLAPFAEDAATLVDVLNRQEGALQRLVSNTGEVFGALSERDGQLRDLIENSNRVFATTAARNRELQRAFVALPTFERESRQTIERLTEFAGDTDPLVTQLRPAARELSPTLDQLADLAPDLEGLFRELDPLITASRTGFPAAEQVLEDARPLLAQADPSLREVIPILDFLAPYKRELTAFLGNVAASTQATTGEGEPHYLRTTNPLSPENLAVYPRRLSTNRPNAYAKPGSFDRLREGMLSYETRQCDGRPSPVLTNEPAPGGDTPFAPLDPQLFAQVGQYAFSGLSGGVVPAPACRQQGNFDVSGRQTRYPQVTALPPG